MSQLTVLLVYSTRTSRFKNKPGPEGQNSNIFYCQAQVVSTSTNEENLESHGLPVARPRHAINKRLRISKRCFGNRSPAANRSARPLQIPQVAEAEHSSASPARGREASPLLLLLGPHIYRRYRGRGSYSSRRGPGGLGFSSARAERDGLLVDRRREGAAAQWRKQQLGQPRRRRRPVLHPGQGRSRREAEEVAGELLHSSCPCPPVIRRSGDVMDVMSVVWCTPICTLFCEFTDCDCVGSSASLLSILRFGLFELFFV